MDNKHCFVHGFVPLNHKLCLYCGKGTLEEFSFFSDMDGEYQCNHCGKKLKSETLVISCEEDF